MDQIFRWIDQDKNVHEYRFTDGVCDGFFSNGVENNPEQNYKGRELTDEFRETIESRGFDLVCEFCDGTGEVSTDESDGEGHIMRGVGSQPCICMHRDPDYTNDDR